MSEVKVNIFDDADVNILVIFDELRVEVFEELNVPVDDDDLRMGGVVAVCALKKLDGSTYLNLKLVPQLIEHFAEVILVLHDAQYQLEHERVDLVHDVLEVLLLRVD